MGGSAESRMNTKTNTQTKTYSTLTAKPRQRPSSNQPTAATDELNKTKRVVVVTNSTDEADPKNKTKRVVLVTNSTDEEPKNKTKRAVFGTTSTDEETKNKTKRFGITRHRGFELKKSNSRSPDNLDKSPEGVKGTTSKMAGPSKMLPVKPQPKPRKPRDKMAENEICKSTDYAWKVVKILGSGGFGDVYKVVKESDPSDKTEYAMKTEMMIGEKRMLRLKVEVTVLMMCLEAKQRKHFVDIIDRGKTEKFKFLVMSLVGSSLEDYRRNNNVDFTASTALQVSIQALEAIRDLHAVGWLHRDIKPPNFAYGLGAQENTVYILDFGIAKRIHDKTQQIKKPRAKVRFLGTLRFASRACHYCMEQGRNDDIETWMYLTFDLFNRVKGLPWKREPDRTFVIVRKERFFDKNHFNDYFKDINEVLKDMWSLVEIVNQCTYFNEPNYALIEEKLLALAKEKHIDLSERLDWVEKKKGSSVAGQLAELEHSEGNKQQDEGNSDAEEDSKKEGVKHRRKKSNNKSEFGGKEKGKE